MRLLPRIALMAAAAVLAACGAASNPDGSSQAPKARLTAPGSTGRSNEAAEASPSKEAGASATAAPGYQSLVERQTGKPATRFSPCNLVSRAQARAILGAPLVAPIEAPQGPTCIYRTKSGRAFITLSVQSVDFGKLKRQMRQRQAVDVGTKAAYCGTYGQPMLYVSLTRGRVLSVAAPCSVARQFATRAIARLS